MSSIGRIFRVTTYGESHCRGVGAVVDGVPPGINLTEADIQPQLTRRRPGQSSLTTPRDEKDQVEILSGTERGKTLGTPISLFVPNLNIRPVDYSEMSNVPRPGHADYTYQQKYGIRASSGGGRSSARETIGRVAAGAIAEKVLGDVEIVAYVSSVGTIGMPGHGPQEASFSSSSSLPRGSTTQDPVWYTRDDVDSGGRLQLLCQPADQNQGRHDQVEAEFVRRFQLGRDDLDNQTRPAYHDLTHGVIYSAWGHVCPASSITPDWLTNDIVTVRCPHTPTAAAMASLIRQVKVMQDSVGGIVTCEVRNVPVGLGEPCFDKLEAMLAHAMLSLPATKGFDIGSGFAGTTSFGSRHNDLFAKHPTDTSQLKTTSNYAGGTLGGISSGANLSFRVAIKPVSTIGQAQETANFAGEVVTLEAKGRHDPCVLPRAVPLVEAMTALVLADAMLIQKTRS